MRKKNRSYRVVTFLGRQELDFLDELEKDIYFDYGIKVSRQRLIQEILCAFMAGGLKSKQELIERILHNAQDHEVDRRKYPRLKKNLAVQYRQVESLQEHEVSNTQDLSNSGIRLEVAPDGSVPAVNQLLEIMVREAEQEPIRAIGKVVWVKEKEDRSGILVGVKITYIRKEDLPRFEACLNPDAKTEEKNGLKENKPGGAK